MAQTEQRSHPQITALATALTQLRRDPAASLPYLSAKEAETLTRASQDLDYRPARRMAGSPGHEVKQDFVLSFNFPPPSPFHDLAQRLEQELKEAQQALGAQLLPAAFTLNDLIVQHYHPGSQGITPHRDHLRYRGLVAIITLAGQGRFQICADRSGENAVELATPPGSLNLMRAPDFDGLSERPFHFLTDITQARVSLGLRWDTRPGEPT